MGVCIHWHSSAAHRAKNKVTAMCSSLRKVRPDLSSVTTDAVGQCPDDLINL
jgi:ferredoxin